MRQVFSSPRLENVERVAAMLEDAGIETRITHGRSYRGNRRGTFSYRDHTRSEPVPAVWIVKSEDQVRGREILRAAGLIETTRAPADTFLPTSAHVRDEAEAKGDPRKRRLLRIKLGLLVVIAVVIALAFVAQRKATVAPPATATAPRGPVLPPGVSPTPDALAAAVLAGELPTRPGAVVCLEVDGQDPAPALLATLAAPPGAVLPVSRCAARPDAPMLLAIGDYRRGPSGAGTIRLERRRGGTTLQSQRYDVRPDAGGWRVIEPYR